MKFLTGLYEKLFFHCFMAASGPRRTVEDSLFYACLSVAAITACYLMVAMYAVSWLALYEGDTFPAIFGFDNAVPMFILAGCWLLAYVLFSFRGRYKKVLERHEPVSLNRHALIFVLNFFAPLVLFLAISSAR